MSSSKIYYNSNSTTKYQAFWLETGPVLSSPNVTPGTGGWGANYNFTVVATDEDGDTMRVRAYTRLYGTSTWTPIGGSMGYQDVSGENKTVTFQKTFSCADLSSNDTDLLEYMFNVTDDPPGPSDTDQTSPKNLTLTKDNTRIDYVSGDNVTIYRPSGNYNLILRIFDLDKNSYADVINTKGEFNVTLAGPGSQYISSGNVYSNDSGYINYTFDPGCSPKYEVGPQKWKGGTRDDICYKNTESSEYNLNIYTDQLNITPDIPNGEHYRRGTDPIYVRAYVNDDCPGGVPNITLTITSETGSNSYECPDGQKNYEGSGWYNCTFQSSQHSSWATLYKYNTTFLAQRSYYNQSNLTKDPDSFWLTEPPDIYYADPALDVTPFGGGWGALHTFTAYVRDEEGVADSVNVTLWKRVGLTGNWTLINQTTVVSYDFTPVVFKHRFNCSESSQTNYYYFNTSDKWNDTNTTTTNNWFMGKDRTEAFATAGLNAQVNREGSSSTFLQVRIRDTDYSNQDVSSGVKG
ncbi:MAG: hypothetical protein MUP55_02135, partial [Candidatus Aenigmarchaeota archaeon]|nr:hypothetical protein [Candidatus Aenigmarchaeota archaeon]